MEISDDIIDQYWDAEVERCAKAYNLIQIDELCDSIVGSVRYFWKAVRKVKYSQLLSWTD